MKLRIKEIIKEKGLKQKRVAEMLGITYTGFNLIVNNKAIPSVETLGRIAKALDVPIYSFFDEERPVSFSAIINNDGVAYEARTPEELRAIASRL